MSLTSFIKIPEVKSIFKKEFPLSKTLLQGDMKAIPVTKNYPLVGTAFDYLFRFYLERENPNCVTKHWVAENSLALLEQTIDEHGKKAPKEMIDAFDKMTLYLHDAKDTHKEYLKSGNLGDDLLKSSIILAQMDTLYRSGIIPPSLGQVEKGDIKDLRNLISLVKPETFKAKKTCFLNPTFGYGSQLVGGADADLIVDDMLVDLKTTKFLSFTQEHYNQLIGYYILSKLGKVNESEDIPISKIGIYFSRHGILHTISAKDIEAHPNFKKFVDVFEKLATVVFNQN
jgi:hypothetical protein